MALIADFLLLAASACACFYCWMLSRRLQKLKSTRKGIAASVASLSRSVDEAKKAIAHSHMAAEESVAKLAPLVAESKLLSAELKTMAKVLSEAQFAPVPEAKPVVDAAAKTDPGPATPEPQPEPMQTSEATPEPVREAVSDTASEAENDAALDDDGGDFEIEWKSDEQGEPASTDVETTNAEENANNASEADAIEATDENASDDPAPDGGAQPADRDVISLQKAS